MKLAISNIAWESKDEDKIFALLKKLNISGIEIAPTKIWENPVKEPDTLIKQYRNELQKQGFAIPSTQAILFNHPELLIFSDQKQRKETANYILKMISVVKNLGAKIIVFGSPKNRSFTDLSYTEVIKIAEIFFHQIADECKKNDIYFCLEPNAKEYGNNFLITTEETVNFIKQLNHPNMKINLDSGNMMLNNENFDKSISLAAEYLYHFQISEPNLLPLDATNENHKIIHQALKSIHYNKWLSIEMRNTDIETIKNSIQVVKQYYEL